MKDVSPYQIVAVESYTPILIHKPTSTKICKEARKSRWVALRGKASINFYGAAIITSLNTDQLSQMSTNDPLTSDAHCVVE